LILLERSTTGDAAIIWCFDNRFELGFRKFLKRIGVLNSDPRIPRFSAACQYTIPAPAKEMGGPQAARTVAPHASGENYENSRNA
jgi:hypothetical protein